MTTKSLFVRLCLAVAVLFTSIGVNAQVTIGASDAPQSFSVLELISDGERGLRLPKMTTAERNAVSGTDGAFGTANATLALGLVVYNTTTNCLEYWNGTRWVSLCDGNSQMVISPAPCQDVAADGTGCGGEFEITDPDCEDGPFSFAIVAGSDFAFFANTNEADGIFSLSFAENNSIHPRSVVVRVTSDCTGLFRDFLFTQVGQECDDALGNAPVITASSLELCVGGAVYLSVPANTANLDQLIWTRGANTEIARGVNHIYVTLPGIYAVHMGIIGCGTSSVTVTLGTTTAPDPVSIIAGANNGFVCDENDTVQLFASAASVGVIRWYWDGVRQSVTGSPVNAGIGTWFAVVEDGGCSSTPSNEVVVALHSSAGIGGIDVPVIVLNGENLGFATSVELCSSGALLLEVATPQSGVTYTWFAGDAQNGVVLGTGSFISTTVAAVSGFPMLQVVAEMANSCAQHALTQFTILANYPPNRPTVTSNTGQTMCGIATELSATVTGAVPAESFIWFRNGVRQSETSSTFAVTGLGTHTVYAVSANGCVSLGSIPFVIDAALGFAQNLQISSGNTTPMVNSMEEYTATMTNATGATFTWSVPAPHSIVSGQGTATVTLSIADDTNAFNLSVVASNDCGYATPNPAVLAITPGNPCVAPNITNHLVGGVSNTLTASVTAGTNPPLAVTVNTFGQAVTYQWQRSTDPNMASPINVGGNTPDLTGVTNLTAGTIHYFRVTVTPTCDTDLAVTSQTFMVNVTVNPVLVPEGVGNLSGTVCFDVGVTPCEGIPTNQRNTTNFASNATHNYIFTATTANVSNVRWVIIDGENLVYSSLSGTLQPGALANGASVTLPVTFRSNVNATLSGRSRAEAAVVEIHVIFFNGTNDVRRTLSVNLQDCSCGCAVRVPTNIRASGWLTFMCHNLGADPNLTVAQQMAYVRNPNNATSNSQTVNGWLFQWGRYADGHQFRTSGNVAGPRTTGLDAVTGQPTPVENRFIMNSSGAQSWNWRTHAGTDDLWTRNNRVNDPCPSGWRIPTDAEWQGILTGGANGNHRAWVSASGSQGWRFYPYVNGVRAPAPTLFLPAAGWRNRVNGALSLVGTHGYYWSSSVSGTDARVFWFNSGSVGVVNGNRALGFSVRCVAE